MLSCLNYKMPVSWTEEHLLPRHSTNIRISRQPVCSSNYNHHTAMDFGRTHPTHPFAFLDTTVTRLIWPAISLH